ncbi:MAG: SDR family NAD(P)-dependent oxidoreductase [Acidimicrobiia bacterium]
MRLADKVCVITGASSGIGRAVAEGFAREGARLLLVARPQDQADLDATAQALPEAVGLASDLSDPEAPTGIINKALEDFGRIDVLVNNAGFADVAPVIEFSLERWDRVFNVNLRAMFLLSQAFARYVIARGGGGAIVNTASINGIRAEPMLAAYNVSKAGVIALSQSLALEFGQHNIRVNAVLPGMVYTRQTASLLDDPKFASSYLTGIPLGRFADPNDIAPAYVFLASEEARYLTGSSLVVDGGLSIGISWPEQINEYPDFT